MNLKEIDQAYVANTYARFPLQLVSGEGSVLQDEQGKSYIDLGAGIAVNSFGVADSVWQQAVTEQLSKLQHTSNLYYTEPCAKLAQMLCERTGMKKVFFSNSGAEANECAIKAVRRYAFLKYGAGHSTIITLKNSFHGRTIATLAATGQDSYHVEFGPYPEGFVYADQHDIEDVRRLANEHDCAAIMFEVVQGEGGVYSLTPEYIEGLKQIAAEKDLLLVVDEVQTGNGRTGKLYGYMHYGLQPDIVTTAKGLAGGLPLGVTMLGERVQDVYAQGTHGSTFGGNPVCTAGAISILRRIDEQFLADVQKKSDYIKEQLQGAKGVKSIDGLGLMLGIESEKAPAAVIAGCMERGVLVLSAKNKVRLLPPLNIPFALLEQAIAVLKDVLAE